MSNYLLENEESERLLFRKLEETDFDTWMDFCRHPDSFKYLGLTATNDPHERCRFWFKRVFDRYTEGRGGMNVLTDKVTGEFIGQCGLLIQTVDETEELEIGYSLMPAHRGKGYALEAARKCRNFAFEKQFRSSLVSIIDIENKASEKVARNNGMSPEKKTIHNNLNVNIFRIRKEDWELLK